MWFYKGKGERNTILREMGNKVEICLSVLGNKFCLTKYMGNIYYKWGKQVKTFGMGMERMGVGHDKSANDNCEVFLYLICSQDYCENLMSCYR